MPADKWNELWNATYSVDGSIALAAGTYNIDVLHITNSASLEFQGNTDDGTMGSGVTFNSQFITIDPGSSISANALGFNFNNLGPGQTSYSGGSHGGRGGPGNRRSPTKRW